MDVDVAPAADTLSRLEERAKRQRVAAYMPAQGMWEERDVDAEYVPPLADSVRPRGNGPLAAISAPCGRGKSFAFRQSMRDVVDAGGRVLLLSANIQYGTNLTHELRQEFGENVGFYKYEDDLSERQIVVCSLESLFKVYAQRFEMLFIDEARTISGLPGGATDPSFGNLALLKRLVRETPCVVACDADLHFRLDATEPLPMGRDFVQYLADARGVVCVNMTHPGPAHLRRSARVYYDCKKAVVGKEQWLSEIRAAAAAWRGDAEARIAVCVGTKPQLTEVCALMKELKVPWKPYSGETCQKAKLEDLKDPDAVWIEFGAIVSTTTLSIGVDPKHVKFARVFMWTNRTGCDMLTQFQAVQRFGRSTRAPLTSTTIDVLLDCRPPELSAAIERPTARPSFANELKKLQKRRGTRVLMSAKMFDAIGGPVSDAKCNLPVEDSLLRLMAHRELERQMLQSCHLELFTSICKHHKWPLEDFVERSAVVTDGSSLPSVATDEDDEFSTLRSRREKLEWGLRNVHEHGEDGFFDSCYGMIGNDGKKVRLLSGREQLLVDIFYLLRPFRCLPDTAYDEDAFSDDVDLLERLDKPGMLTGVQLNAASQCITPVEQDKRDARRSLTNEKAPHVLCKVPPGAQMHAAREAAKLLDVESLFVPCELPRRVLDICNREKKGLTEPGDHIFLQQLRAIAESFSSQGGVCDKMERVLRSIITGCGMRMKVETVKGTTRGDRTWTVRSIVLERAVPESLMECCHVYSDDLRKEVAVGDWEEAHMGVVVDSLELQFGRDDELDEGLFTPSPRPLAMLNSLNQRTEKVDGVALHNELSRLRLRQAQGSLGPLDTRWLAHLEAIDAVALPRVEEGAPPPTVREVVVTYGKRRNIGRRVASHPSYQYCPSSLRPLLAERFYHDLDIVNCHPTLFLQVAEKMDVPKGSLAALREYVTDRDAVLQRIAAFYGVTAALCKFAVLRVLNGGSPHAWARDAKCPHNADSVAPELADLGEAARVVQEAFFDHPEFKPHVDSLRSELSASTRSNVQSAQAEYHNATTPQAKADAKRKLDKARMKASGRAINRTILSLCIFELEDRVLHVIDEHMRRNGWTVSSLQFDGLHVEHRNDADLEAAMQGAEAAVKRELGYVIQLKEKELYQAEGENNRMQTDHIEPIVDSDDDL